MDALAGSTLAIDGHLLVRGVHVIAATLLVGGGVLAWAAWLDVRSGVESRAALRTAIRYEWLAWGALGLLVATGVGNLGVFGEALPAPESTWGRVLTVKLGNDLDGLSTGVGLGLYALLWAASLFGTAGALRRIGHDIGASTDRVVGAGALWGGVAGAAFLIVGLLALALYSAVEGVAEVRSARPMRSPAGRARRRSERPARAAGRAAAAIRWARGGQATQR